jgi:hypothetical protein
MTSLQRRRGNYTAVMVAVTSNARHRDCGKNAPTDVGDCKKKANPAYSAGFAPIRWG